MKKPLRDQIDELAAMGVAELEQQHLKLFGVLVRVLSAERVPVLHAVRTKPAGVSELAATLRRDRKAVKRDVSLLESFGLVSGREEINPGHGRRRIIEPRAAKYQLVATI